MVIFEYEKAHQNPTDTKTLLSHLKQFSELYELMSDTVTADAGHGSEQNHLFKAENEIQAFVKDNYFDKDWHDKGIKNPFSGDNLYYDQENNCYSCPKDFKRFMLGGCDKVKIEAGLLNIVHNLKKWSC